MSEWETLQVNLWLVYNMPSPNHTKTFKEFFYLLKDRIFIFLSNRPIKTSRELFTP